MAKVVLGILDGFIGKVGTVVGAFWKGLPVMRAYKRKAHNPQSELQMLVRARFTVISKLASDFLSALYVGLGTEARKLHMTEGDLFVRKNWGAVTATSPDNVTTDYGELIIAAGPQRGVQFGSPRFDNPLEVELSFSTNDGEPKTTDDDLVYVFAYSPDVNDGILSQPVKRSTQSMTLTVPGHWSGQKVHLWGFVVGDGTENKGAVSDSVYVGSGNIS